ncbi:siderophore-interacting protein [Corynebacterium heidelbergense]|uniref:NADPH-dependent ferric siderophore reductase n=1 Tax=Corynebacterium heidelbergense TaxID=2055947 RepID=A0A364V7G8_9CORY|nr:siderophore-interacting protein [Corynebacterium heidelbergense]RAV32610.1 NADPH-dependent ferric siderophore reductase [Corynebacterium heidelbergense]
MLSELERILVRTLGSGQTTLTVLSKEWLSDSFVRVTVDCGQLFSFTPAFPTLWLRLWFPAGDAFWHQRAFTIVGADEQRGRAHIEFTLHDGIASDWARAAEPGWTIQASLLGSKTPWGLHVDELATSTSKPIVLVGDMASLPAMNSLLGTLVTTPITAVVENRLASDAQVPVCASSRHQVIRCQHDSGPSVTDVAAQCVAQSGDSPRVWVALEAGKTRSLVKRLRADYGITKTDLCSLGYWKAVA